ncbi:BTAD domain-containing putative transcriptional regulator [Streptomyces sp. NPDC048611]|uniref:AfsR/SARP family transcriptional regulator n=1 Tax=Streptomyces sp. NPDC048611 TaxID=3155635 RepID=UPI0034374703
MHYGILGTTQARRADGTPVALGGARLRALLAALALRPGRALSPELLIGDVWEAQPPADAAGALQALVGRLRRALGHTAIASVDGGYRLCAEPDAVDLHRFERLAAEGARALADADPSGAAALLDDALALWRGPALADLPDPGAEAARAERRRLDAQCTRLAADLALGRAAQALPTLLALCEVHPLDEPLQALRLHALRAAGRTAEALAAYEEIRTGLAERLGADPGPELRTLHAELLRPPSAPTDPPPSPLPGTPAPAPYATADGTPYATAPGNGTGPASHPRPGNLRARLTSFVGRDADLTALRADLAGHRLVTLLGPGGAGKTRLAQEGAETTADALPDTWPHGVWLAELAPVDDPLTVPEAVLTALGARETVVRGTAAEGLRAAADPTALDPLARLAEHCAGRRMLLVLDNCEHVIDAAAALAERLLADCPGVTVLATSREPLAVPGEVLRPVEPLPGPVALRLLADRGAAARPGFRADADEETAAACTEICRRLDGLPLAIELAAARLRLLSPRQLADRLDDRFRLLTSGSRTLLPRQQTLRAVVDWSWELTDEPERAVLRRLSVFAGGCDLAAAEEVCAGDGVDAREVAVLLGSLIDKSLVVAAPAGAERGGVRAAGQMRYRLLETVAEYAGERLDEAGERAATERRHLVAYRELARTTDPLLRGAGQRAGMERLELEHDNLRTALRRALAARDEHEALCLVLSLQWFWSLRDHRSDARHWATAASALGPNPFARPAEPAPDLHERPIDTPPPLSPEQLLEARREVRLVALSSRDSDLEALHEPEMREELAGMLTAYRAGMPQTCKVPGVMWHYAVLITGRFDELMALVDGAVRACRDFGYEWELAYVLQLRSKFFNDRPGGMTQAAGDADEALRLFRRLGDAWGAAEALAGRGENHEKRGAYGPAADDYRAAMVHAEDLGAQGQIMLLRCRLGAVLIEDGQEEAGERLLREVLTDAAKGNSGRDTEPFARLTLAMWLTATGRLREARAELQLVRTLFAPRSPDLFAGMLEALLISLDVDEGHREGLLPRFRWAMELMQDSLAQTVAPDLPVVQLLTGARMLLSLRGTEAGRDAARLVGAYDALRTADQVPPRLVRRDRARTEEAVRALLDDASYTRAHAEGGGLSLGEATALI